MLFRTTALLLIVGALTVAGCGGGGRDGESAPLACGEGASIYLEALKAAPGDVFLAGEGPISDCLVSGAEEGELANLGEASLNATQQLNLEARAQPGGKANIELGFLVGAIARGSEDTEGVHSTLLDRLTSAAKYVPAGESVPQAFRDAYEEGFAAGRDHG